jgi:murein DD-endopeptidase MepM/ murein hydrolase activator NlpD
MALLRWMAALGALLGTVLGALVFAAGPASGAAVGVDDSGANGGVQGRAPAPSAEYGWPLVPVPVVVALFREPAHPFGPGHRGVDLAAPAGAAVLAAAAGTVVFAGALAGRGVVSVQHADGLRTTYEPVTPAVRTGEIVARGAVVGALVAGHLRCPSACLHWGARRDRTKYVDPLLLLRPARVRLLPLPVPWPDEVVTPAGGPARAPPSGALA